MKNLLLFSFLFLLVTTSYSQNKTLGVGIAVPNPNAALHVESPTANQGFIMPRLTTVQRVAMALTTTDNGLMVYDIDLKANYIWDGAIWTNAAKLTLPTAVTLTTADLSSATEALNITYNGNDARTLLRLDFTNAANTNTSNPFVVNHAGVGAASVVTQSGTLGTGGLFQLTNAVNSSNALRGLTNGTGIAGNFVINNAASTAVALRSTTNGSGPGIYSTNTGTGNGFAGLFENTIVTNTYPGIQAGTAGTGTGVRVIQNATSIGGGMDIFMQNATSSANGFSVDQLGLGGAGRFVVNNAANTSPALNVETNGLSFGIRSYTTGAENAGYFEISNPATVNSALAAITNGTANAVVGVNTGTGRAATFDITNVANSQTSLEVRTLGTGRAGNFIINNVSNSSHSIYSETNGTGAAGYFKRTNNSVWNNGVVGENTGLGTGGTFYKSGSSGGAALEVVQNGTGDHGVVFFGQNTGSTQNLLFAHNNGAGSAAFITQNGATGNILDLASNYTIKASVDKNGKITASSFQGDGSLLTNLPAISFPFATSLANASTLFNVTNTGTGSAGSFSINNSSNNSPTIQAITDGLSHAIRAETTNTSTSQAAIYGTSNALTVYAANFRNTNVASVGGAIYLVSYGTGSTATINHRGSAGNIVDFQDQDAKVARIDKTGRGFFNGGTQTGGADVAEMFDVEGARENYEPGDVLVISESTDRTVEKSSTTNSTKVVGVYATKPGVTLTEKGIDENLDQLVPMGVIGVIPTKVCLENGAIKRGDLLVTSSTSGHAMKAISAKGDGMFPAGVIIGKALENFDQGVSGLIKVLVNVK